MLESMKKYIQINNINKSETKIRVSSNFQVTNK